MRAVCSFLAFNGYYKLFGWLYVGELGAHDADWCGGTAASCRSLLSHAAPASCVQTHI